MPTIESTPYPWPYDGRFSMNGFTLIILNPEPYETDRPDRELDQQLQDYASKVQALGGLVFEVNCLDPRTRKENPDKTVNWPSLYSNADYTFHSYGIDGCYSSPLEQVLNDRNQHLVGLAGRWFETSIHSTMRELNDRGFECLAISDLSDCLVPELKRNTISQIEMSGGIFGAVGTSRQLKTLFN